MDNTYGVILFDPSARLLITKPTASNIWSFPKGLSDPGESPKETAIRETLEETNIDLKVIQGVFLDKIYSKKYAKSNKMGHFLVFLSEENLLDYKLICTSTFERYGKKFPENDAFQWLFPEEAIPYVHEAQQRVLEELISDINNAK